MLRSLCVFLFMGCWQSFGNAKLLYNATLDSYPLSQPGKLHDQMKVSATNPSLNPGSKAQPFSIWSLRNGLVKYPSLVLPENAAIGIHAFSNRSGFLESMWSNPDSLVDFVNTSPIESKYIFMTFEEEALMVVSWMETNLKNALARSKLDGKSQATLYSNCHFVVTPVSELGNWLTSVLMQWSCSGHGCGYDQIAFTSKQWTPQVLVVKRLDARYDWAFSHQWKPVAAPVLLPTDLCQTSQKNLTGQVVVIPYDKQNCSVAQKIVNMQNGGAAGVVVYSPAGAPIKEVTCSGELCNEAINIPVMSIRYNQILIKALEDNSVPVFATLQTTSSPNFFVTVDAQGELAEAGWFLYPSLQFLAWQMQWHEYVTKLNSKISTLTDYVVPVFNETVMVGKNGTGYSTVTFHDLSRYQKLYLDMQLSCPGDMDEECPPWDHVPVLYVTCNDDAGNMIEVGRWITSFRRRVGHWLTDVSPLMPLFGAAASSRCTFQLKMNAWWAQPWVATLTLRFVEKPRSFNFVGQWTNAYADIYPERVTLLFEGGTFDKNYNSKYKPYEFNPPAQAKAVKIYAVITGHGSDNNNCAEFCPTSHQFTVNNRTHSTTFSNAGTPLGCAERVPQGVVPNEHGTWLYGRDGWCDGQQVDPWIIDITSDIHQGSVNTVTYRGLFNGKDPNPTENPGVIRMISFLVYYF